MEKKPRPKLGRNVIGLGAVSFFTDVSTEMIYPLLPVFLAGVLGANASFIGAIEGTAETTASLLKLLSGWWSDKVSARKPGFSRVINKQRRMVTNASVDPSQRAMVVCNLRGLFALLQYPESNNWNKSHGQWNHLNRWN